MSAISLTIFVRNRNMTVIEKSDCTDTFKVGFNHTGRWRGRLANKFPGDPRNAKAATYLLKLADEAGELTDQDWARLQPHYEFASKRFQDAVSETGRLVGFQHKITNLHSFVDALVDVLSKPVAA
jgi:hypothetical protein